MAVGQLNQVDDNSSDESVDIASKIEQFEYQIDRLRNEIKSELSAKPDITVKTLIHTLTSLPLSLRREYESSITRFFPDMRKEKQVDDLFLHLNPLTSFIDYGLIEHFITKFGSDGLKRDMKSYCCDMLTFMKQTTIKQLIDFLPGKQEAPKNFAILKAKIGENASTCTLDKINTLRKRFCSEVQLSEVVFCLIALEDSNSFIVSWLVPSILVPDLIKSASEVKESFFDIENIISLWLYRYNSKLTTFGSKLKQQFQKSQDSPSPVEWIPSPTRKIFRLAMIQKERLQQGHIEDRFVRMTISGKVDDILHAKSPVELEHIFRNTLHRSEIILIEGTPGSGKSTLTVHICQRWGKGDLFQQFMIVILVQLRDPAVQRAQTIADLLPVENVAVAQKLATELIATNGHGVLWVLDGWDELPTHLQQDSIFRNLIQPKQNSRCMQPMPGKKRLLYECSVVVTSRPISSGDLHPVVSSRIEVLGFTPEEQRQYFTECLKGDTKALEALFEKIQENPVVQSICYVPLNAAFVVHSFQMKGQLLANTVYEIFSTVILSCIQRHFEREGRGNYLSTELASLDDLYRNETVRELFRCLCELAYHGVMENKVTFSSNDLPQGPNTLSLLQAIESFVQSGKSVFYNFLHLSIQEVLSAYYIATWLSDSEQVSQFQQLFDQPRFAAVFQFYSAITKLKRPGIRQVIVKILQAESNHLLASLLRCLYEAQDPSLCLYVAEKLKYKLNLNHTSLSPLDYLSVSFFLSSVSSMNISVSLRRCYISELYAKYLTKYLGNNVDHVGGVTIDLYYSGIREEGALHITRILYFIEHIYLSYNPIGNTGASSISEAVRNTAVLKTLIMYNCGITSSGVEDLSKALARNSSLNKLDIGGNNLGDKGISHVAEALKQNAQLKELWISNCGMTDKGAASLASALSINNSLKMLHMGGERGALTGTGLSTITQSLANNPEFVKLAVSDQFNRAALRHKVNLARSKHGLPLIKIKGEYCMGLCVCHNNSYGTQAIHILTISS